MVVIDKKREPALFKSNSQLVLLAHTRVNVLIFAACGSCVPCAWLPDMESRIDIISCRAPLADKTHAVRLGNVTDRSLAK